MELKIKDLTKEFSGTRAVDSTWEASIVSGSGVTAAAGTTSAALSRGGGASSVSRLSAPPQPASSSTRTSGSQIFLFITFSLLFQGRPPAHTLPGPHIPKVHYLFLKYHIRPEISTVFFHFFAFSPKKEKPTPIGVVLLFFTARCGSIHRP